MMSDAIKPITQRSVVVIDNYDSFTWNLVHYLQQIADKVTVYRNDEIDASALAQKDFSHLLISPGPCTPNESGESLNIIKHFKNSVPILGVCLGHQALAQVFGGNIISAPKIMHGKTSEVVHQQRGLFSGLPSPLTVTRYHSLVVDPKALPAELEITAWVEEQGQQTIMGIQHTELPLYGVQFHPESILSESGLQLLRNFLHLL